MKENTKEYEQDFDTICKELIFSNDKLSLDIKNKWNKLMPKDYLLRNLSDKDIKEIIKMYDELEILTINQLEINEKTSYLMSCIRVEFMLDLHRCKIVEDEPSGFWDMLKNIFKFK